ncbi:hypothetical protein R4466_04910 [Acinetobacter baumannii]|uniref:hypothetical protein n=1 Tax=Acinetobacter calcoaceticus/baumannii complex TaxID=909768 RepID=UPI0009E10D0A|nr:MULTISPECIES: hypothetical protein [Acinetobacter calcoaceticus/baumannii complex]ARG16946.1 hypothetical protein B7L44_10295 [Acinetobacter nosocomialis]MDV7379952.1 hypothetical protein [Acinetobacter baumannii]
MSKSDFSFHKYISNQSPEELEAYAERAGTTVLYLKRHLIHRTRLPRVEMIQTLVTASNGAFTKVQFIAWLYELDASYLDEQNENMIVSGGFKHAVNA